KAEQAYSGFSLGLQFRQDVLAGHADRAGFRVEATTGSQYRRRAAIGHPHHHWLALANGRQRAIEFGLRAELLRAVGTTHQSKAGNSHQTKQQTMQHAQLSINKGADVARSITSAVNA